MNHGASCGSLWQLLGLVGLVIFASVFSQAICHVHVLGPSVLSALCCGLVRLQVCSCGPCGPYICCAAKTVRQINKKPWKKANAGLMCLYSIWVKLGFFSPHCLVSLPISSIALRQNAGKGRCYRTPEGLGYAFGHSRRRQGTIGKHLTNGHSTPESDNNQTVAWDWTRGE